jgi:hypothetical protein
MYGVRHDFSYYRMMLITPSMLTDYHYMVDTFYDDVEKAVSHHVNLGRHYRFLWRRAEEYLQSDVPRARKFRVVMAGTRRGMPYLGYEADKHKVQHSNSNRIRICRKINKIKYYARLNPDISQEEIDGKIAAARRRAREKATVTTMRQKQRVMELENSKTNWMYDRVRRMRVRSIKKIIGKYRRERMSAIWREEK